MIYCLLQIYFGFIEYCMCQLSKFTVHNFPNTVLKNNSFKRTGYVASFVLPIKMSLKALSASIKRQTKSPGRPAQR